MPEKKTLRLNFDQISTTPINFNLKKDDIVFNGNLVKKNSKIVVLNGKINGDLIYPCDRCGKEFKIKISEDISLYLSNGVYEDGLHEITNDVRNNPNLDVIEFFDGFIDIEEILNSEIEAYKSGYFYCDNCINL